MSRLIDADALKESMGEPPLNWNNLPEEIQEMFDWNNFTQLIDDAPTIEAEPVRHGHWVEKEWFDGDTYYDCSACGHSWVTIEGTPQDNEMNYCPYCGCHMKEEE